MQLDITYLFQIRNTVLTASSTGRETSQGEARGREDSQLISREGEEHKNPVVPTVYSGLFILGW